MKHQADKSALRSLFFRAFIIFTLVSIITFSTLFYYIRFDMSQEIEDEINTISSIMTSSILVNTEAAIHYEEIINNYLNHSSKMIYDKLEGKNISNITEKELDVMKEKLGLNNLLLVTLNNEEFQLEKIANKEDNGILVYLNQNKELIHKLINDEESYINSSLLASETNNNEYHKFGIYYNKDKNYFIVSHLIDTQIHYYTYNPNIESFIENTISNHSYIEEISVISFPYNFLENNDKKSTIPITYGDNKYKSHNEDKLVLEALKTNTVKKVTFNQDGNTFTKIIIPINNQEVFMIVANDSSILKLTLELAIMFFIMLSVTLFLTLILVRVFNKKNLMVMSSEQERLKVAEEFKRTIELLPNFVYRLQKQDDEFIIVYSEGKKVEELKLNTKYIYGENASILFGNKNYLKVLNHLKEAFSGKTVEFKVDYDGLTYQHFIKPAETKDNNVIEIAGFATDITEQIKYEKEIERLQMYDTLTGLPNKDIFNDEVEERIKNIKDEELFSIIYVNVNSFKTINETFGHSKGDEILKEISDRLISLKENYQDIIVSRMGGDEFAILTPYSKDKNLFVEISEEIMRQFSISFNINNHEIFLTTTIGISVYPYHAKDGHTLLKYATIAVDCIKDRNKNDYAFFEESMLKDTIERLQLERDLKEAIKNEEFQLYYQPQINIQENKIVGAEALIRWIHPEKGFMSPADFIPLAEQTGLIVPIGEWVLKMACLKQQEWVKKGFGLIRIGVNLSAKQFNDPHLVDKIKDILEETGANPEYIDLEITETISMIDIKQTINILQQMKDLGLKTSIDDFGTGYSSLNYLKSFPIHTLKIDRSFINEINVDKNGEAVAKSIIDLAKNLNLNVIAEGVEKDFQIDFLRTHNCDEVQGYIYSPPVTADKFEEFYKTFKNI